LELTCVQFEGIVPLWARKMSIFTPAVTPAGVTVTPLFVAAK
jgi:hypothetical protein